MKREREWQTLVKSLQNQRSGLIQQQDCLRFVPNVSKCDIFRCMIEDQKYKSQSTIPANTCNKYDGTLIIALLKNLFPLPISTSLSPPSLSNYTHHHHHHHHHHHQHLPTFYTISTLHFQVTGLRISARAIAKRCFWPPLSCVPASPTWLPEKHQAKHGQNNLSWRVKGEAHNRDT